MLATGKGGELNVRYPMDVGDLAALGRRQASLGAERWAYRFVDHRWRVRSSLSFAELDRRAARLAQGLKGGLGRRVGLGDRVVLALPPGEEFLIALWACFYRGAVAVPVPSGARDGGERLAAVVADCRPALGIAGSATGLAAGPTSGLPWTTCGELAATAQGTTGSRFEIPAPTHAALLQYTSGSTGAPKGVVVTHGGLLANLETIRRAFALTAADVVGSWLPPFHDMGLVGTLLAPFYAGASAVVTSPWTFLRRPLAWLEMVDRFAVTVSGAPHFAYELCADRLENDSQPWFDGPPDLSAWRLAFCGAEPIFASGLERFTAATAALGFRPQALLPCYGLAEATLLVSAAVPGQGVTTFALPAADGRPSEGPAQGPDRGPDPGPSFPSAEGRVVACGEPSPGVALTVAEGGEVEVRSGGLAAGYWRQPALSAETFRPAAGGERGLLTGDLGFLRDGQLYLTGRRKDLIIVRGRNLFPQDLERVALAAIPQLQAAAAFAVAEGSHESFALALELPRTPGRRQEAAAQGSEEDPWATLPSALRARLLDHFEVEPARLYLLPPASLPRTTSGKLRRQECRRRLESGELEPLRLWQRQEVPAEQLEAALERLRELLSERAGSRPKTGAKTGAETGISGTVEDPSGLAALGLDSLAAAEALGRLEAETGLTLEPAELLAAQEWSALGQRLRRRPALVEDDGGGEESWPLSPGQKALFYLQQLDPAATAYHIGTALEVAEPVAGPRFEAAVRALLAVHPILASRVKGTAPELRQETTSETLLAPDLVVADARSWEEAALEREISAAYAKPFDLEQAPPLRVRLWLRPGGAVLMLVAHHLAADLTSMALLWRHLAFLWAAPDEFARRLRVAELRARVQPFSRWVRRQDRWLRSAEARSQEAFWQRQLAARPERLELPADRPRPEGSSLLGFSLRARLPGELSLALEELARQQGATLYVLLLAAWQVLLARLSGQASFLTGSLSSGRRLPADQDTVGYLVNPFPLWARLPADVPFAHLVSQLRDPVLEVLGQARLPLPRLVEVVQSRRGAGGAVLFETLFNLLRVPAAPAFALPPEALPPEALPAETPPAETLLAEDLAPFLVGAPGGQVHLGSWRGRSRPLEPRGSQFDLSLHVAPAGAAGLWSRLEASSARFDVTTAQRFLSAWCRLLEHIVAQPQTSWQALALLSAGQRHQLLMEANEPVFQRWTSLETVVDWIDRSARRRPRAVALRWGSQTLSYGQLTQRAGRLATALAAAGAGPERPVALALPRGPDLVVGLLAILRCGAPFLPLEALEPAERQRRIVAAARPVVILGEEGCLSHAGLAVLDPSSWPQAVEEREPCATPPTGAAYILFTSGSTGEPKGVVISHGGLANRLAWMQQRYGLGPLDRVLQKTPITFDVSVWELLWPLTAGAELVLAPPASHRDPQQVAELVRRHQVTVIHFVPSLLRELLRYGEARLCRSLRLVIASGEALTPDLVAAAREAWGAELQLENLYGPTEASIDVSFWSCGPAEPSAPIPIGRPIPGLALPILGRDGRLVPPTAAGELCIGGVGLARGYVGDPRRTAAAFQPDPFALAGPGGRLYRTGDRCRQAPGGPIHFLGRLDQQLKLFGVRLELGEVEAALLLHPEVAEAAVMPLYGPEVEEGSGRGGGELRSFSAGAAEGQSLRSLVAYWVPRREGVGQRELQAFLRQRLPAAMVPGIFIPLQSLPRTSSGKLARRALPAADGSRGQAASSSPGQRPFKGPVSAAQKALCTAWSRVLGGAAVAVDENFFDLGGDSIRFLQVRSELRSLGWDVSLANLQRYPRVAEVEPYLLPWIGREEQGSAARPFALVRPADRELLPSTAVDAYPLTRTQSGVFFHRQFEPGTAMYRDIFVCHGRGPLVAEALAASLQRAVDRHDMLRTSFHLSRYSEPLQVVHGQAAAQLRWLDLRDQSGTAERRLAAWVEEEKAQLMEWRQAPVLRCFALRLEAGSFALAFSFSDVLLDGWSAASLAREVLEGYDERLRGVLPSLAAPPVARFRDFVEAEQRALGSEDLRHFWQQRLAGLPSCRLPSWRAQEGPAETRVLELTVPGPVTAGLGRLREEAQVPLKSVLLAVHLLVMARFRGEGPPLTGLEVSCRPEERGSEEVLGMHMNVLPLAVLWPPSGPSSGPPSGPPSGPSFRAIAESGTSPWAWVKEVYRQETEVQPYRCFPFSEMVRGAGREDLVATLFNFTRFHVLARLGSLERLELLGAVTFNRTSFQLRADFNIHPMTDQLKLSMAADLRQLGPGQLAALGRAYQRLLNHFAGLGSETLGGALDLDRAQRHQLLAEGNDVPELAPGPETLHDIFLATARRWPEEIALEVRGEAWTYQRLAAAARQLAERLRRQGVGVGGVAPRALPSRTVTSEDIVALAVDRSAALPVAVLAVSMAGGIYMPLNVEDPPRRQQALLAQAGARLLLTQGWPEADLQELPVAALPVFAKNPAGTDLAAPTEKVPLPAVGPENLAYLLFTSGSTGRPKAVAVRQGAAARLVRALGEELAPRPGQAMAALTPLSFDISVLELFLPWSRGGRVVLVDREDSRDGIRLRDVLEARPVEVIQATPSTWRMLLDAGWQGHGNLRLLCGGEAMRRSLAAELLTRAREVWNLYGPTETTIWSSAAAVRGLQEPVCLGRPLSGNRFYSVDALGRLALPGVKGELLIGGETLARGYWRSPALTAAAFVPDPWNSVAGSRIYRTGDGVRREADGRWTFLGRLDHQVKVRGYRVEPAEIVEALEAHPGVTQAVVVERQVAPDHAGLVAYWVPAGAAQIAARELRSFLLGRLPAALVPALFVTLPSLPKTAHGKVDLARLPAPRFRRPRQEELERLLAKLDGLTDEEAQRVLGSATGGGAEI